MLALAEQHAGKALQAHLAADGGEINLTAAVKDRRLLASLAEPGESAARQRPGPASEAGASVHHRPRRGEEAGGT